MPANEATLQWLAAFPSVESLYLTNFELTDLGLDPLLRLPQVRSLWLHRVQAPVETFSNLTADCAIEQISFWEMQLGEGTVAALAGLPKLSHIYLHESEYQRNELQSLLQARPDVDVQINGESARANLPYAED
jgi:hypothetical protein